VIARLDWVSDEDIRGEKGRGAYATPKPEHVLVAGLLVLCGSLAYQALFVVVGSFPIYLWLGAAASFALLGIAYYVFREIKKWRSLAVFQILLGCAGGAGALLASGSLPSSCGGIISAVMGIAGAVITVANGVEKLRKLPERHGIAA
jgi:peptidoglycan/LPS O-acetylase OafA/YrhL